MGSWLGCAFDLNGEAVDILSKFSQVVSSKSKMLWQIFWHDTVWHIWKARNGVIFKGETTNLVATIDIIKRNCW